MDIYSGRTSAQEMVKLSTGDVLIRRAALECRTFHVLMIQFQGRARAQPSRDDGFHRKAATEMKQL